MNRRNFITFIVLLMAIAGSACQSDAQNDASSLKASGMIEAQQVNVASEIGGRVVEVLVDEGQRVTVDQPLVRLDDASLMAQRDEARAALQAAQASLDRLQAGATQDQIRAVEAQLAQAEANLRMAQANRDAVTHGIRPEIVTAIHEHLSQVRTRYDDMQAMLTVDQIDKALSARTTAERNLDSAQLRRDRLVDASRHSPDAIAAARDAVDEAQAAVDATDAAYAAITDESETYATQINRVYLSWELATANLDQAQARHDSLADDEDTTPEEMDAAEATVEDAQDLVEATMTAYDVLTAGTSASQLRALWAEIQQEQAQLAGSASSPSELTGTANEISAVVTAQGLTVRAGPGTEYDRVGAVGQGTDVMLNGRNASGTWVRGRIPDENLTGWISAAFLNVDGDVTTLPATGAGQSLTEAAVGTSAAAGSSPTLSVEAMLAQVDAATAARDVARANLAELKAGARSEDIAAAEAGVAQAQARLDGLQIQLDRTTLHAPVNGVVASRSIQPGEIASPGAPLLRLVDLDQVKLTVYVPETQFGKVQLGQTAQVSVDSFPDRTFEGEVTFIAQAAEFTPENVQTAEQRAKLVFAVRISLDNPEHLLKPGMPADATILIE